MAMDMFIKFEGDIKGESKGKGYTDAIDVLAWSWGISNSGTMHMGGGGGAGKSNVQDLSFTKYIDKSSTKLALAALNGDHIDKVTLTVQKAGGKAEKYIIIILTNVLVTSVSLGGSGGEDRLTENVTLNFETVNYDYHTQNEKGAVVSAGPINWVISANADAA
jgi:type VI secretion system secreted protein Hcp